MPKIHPSAIVDPQAQLADDVEIGPHCVLDGPAVVGEGCRLIGHVYLSGRVVLGAGSLLYPFVCLGFEPQDRKFAPGKHASAGVRIGARNVLREGVTVHAATQTKHPTFIGDDNYLMTNAHVGHDAVVGGRCNLATGSMLGGHAELADDVNLGGGAAVHQFCRLGRLSFLGGISGVAMDVPPFCIASGINNVMGLNLVGLRRQDMSHQAIDALKRAFHTLYLAGHTNSVAAALIEQEAAEGGEGAPLLRELARFVGSSRRGLVPHAATSARQKLHR